MDHDGLADYLRREVPGFAESPELEPVSANRQLPEAVAGALGRYLLRLQAREIRREADPAESAALDRAFGVLEELAASDDPRVRGTLATAVFDPLHTDDVVVAVVETRLGPRSSALFRRWAV